MTGSTRCAPSLRTRSQVRAQWGSFCLFARTTTRVAPPFLLFENRCFENESGSGQASSQQRRFCCVSVPASSCADRQFENRARRFPHNVPLTKEAYYIRQIFESHFPSIAAMDTVPGGPSIACSTAAAIEWCEHERKTAPLSFPFSSLFCWRRNFSWFRLSRACLGKPSR
jgi:hypothetical protein